MTKTSIGIIGCGNISDIYLKNLTGMFANTRVKACADLMMERAQAKAAAYPGVLAMEVKQLLADPEIELVVNLTIPGAHHAVSRAIIDAGKHVYAEKPLAITMDEGRDLIQSAAARGVRVGNAPDTFLGGSHQNARRLIDDGTVGQPVACTAFMVCGGHESWHPDPAFYYQRGGGPLFDMGPYYLTALVNLLGPVRRVTAGARISFAERLITSEPKKGTRVKVEVPTHVAGVLEFANGALGTLIMSFDVRGGHHLPFIEVYGAEASLSVPDPNTFGGTVKVRKAGGGEWTPSESIFGFQENSRGIGAADLAAAAVAGRKTHRASGDLALHVLEIMNGLHEAAATGRHVAMASVCERPAPLARAGASDPFAV